MAAAPPSGSGECSLAHGIDPIVSAWEPKPDGGRRRMAIFSERDARTWHLLCGRIAAMIEPRLGTNVLANRVRRPGPRWSFEPLGDALGRARTGATAIRANVLLSTDVADFYPSVTPSMMFRSLRRARVPAGDARAAADMLAWWGSEGYPGLPIGPPGSAVLGNAVLMAVDEALRPLPILRWVDDYLVGLSSERSAAEAIERLDQALADLDLRRSTAKTVVLDGGLEFRWLGTSPAATRR